MPLDIAAEARSWRDSHGDPGETTPEQIFCLQLLTERMWRAAARNRRSVAWEEASEHYAFVTGAG
jgi:hypothetical protein